MHIALVVVGVLLLLIVLWDTFETIVMPKTVSRRLRITALYYDFVWRVWAGTVKHMRDTPRRTAILGAFGPMSLLVLMATWASLLVLAFGLIHFGAGTVDGTGVRMSFGTTLYFSGTTFFTVGFGDVTPVHGLGRFLAVLEAGCGFGFLALIISYFPILYQAFSRREHQIVLLDSKAGSDPSAGELLRRHAEGGAVPDLIRLLRDWELWSAQQLETFLSYPVLALYRSQHDDQSWLCSVTAILDACSILAGGFEGDPEWEKPLVFQAQATFAMARHLIVDLAYLLDVPPVSNPKKRISKDEWLHLKSVLKEAGLVLEPGGETKIIEHQALYEPYAVALARDLFLVLPAWMPQPGAVDNWQTTAWDVGEHF